MFTPLQDILPKTVRKFGIERELESALVCQKYRVLAPRVLRPDILDHTHPKYFKGKTLTIGVENSAWAAHLKEHKEKLIEAINKELGKKVIERLQTRV